MQEGDLIRFKEGSGFNTEDRFVVVTRSFIDQQNDLSIENTTQRYQTTGDYAFGAYAVPSDATELDIVVDLRELTAGRRP